MSGLTFKERFIRSLERKEVDKVPVCSVTQTGFVELMELTGSKWPEAHYDPEKMATLAIAGHEIAGLEAIRYPFCNTVMPETLGCSIAKGSLDTQPYMLDHPIKNKEDVNNFYVPEKLLESNRIQTMMKATYLIKEQFPDEVPVVAGVLGPAAISCYLCGIKNYLRWCVTETDIFKELLDLGTEVCMEYANALFDHGADAVVIIDSEAGPDLLPPPFFEPLILPQYKRLIAGLNGHSILHICGDATAIMDEMAQSGFEGLSIEEKTDLSSASRIVRDRACIIGNVSPASTLLAKPPGQIKKEAKQCIEDGTGILAPGCGIAPRTPLENIKAFVASRDEFYREKGLV